MLINLYIFRMLMYFTGYDSVHFAPHCPTKKGLAEIAWGLMHIPVMMHYLVIDGRRLELWAPVAAKA